MEHYTIFIILWKYASRLIHVYTNFLVDSCNPTFYFFRKDIKLPDNSLKILFFSIITSLISISLFSPNDSNIDWGSRYVSGLILLFILYIKKLYDLQFPLNKKFAFIIVILLSLYSVTISKKYLNMNITLSQKNKEIKTFYLST